MPIAHANISVQVEVRIPQQHIYIYLHKLLTHEKLEAAAEAEAVPLEARGAPSTLPAEVDLAEIALADSVGALLYLYPTLRFADSE